MNLKEHIELFQPAIELELKQAVRLVSSSLYQELHNMMTYHLGWEVDQAVTGSRGKRIRPMLLLLTTAAANGEWKDALPAAASVELIHNFSLLHDDIEDHSTERRGRPTIWVKWGVPQAINAGDAMFSIAHLAMLKLEKTTSPNIALKAAKIIQKTCLDLTRGQYLDISYENRRTLTIDDYWPMINGKTAALIAASCELGALIAASDKEEQKHYRTFGFYLGLSFQVLDDFLGIWGDSEVLGKSNFSDLVTRKKTLPILFALDKKGEFAIRWDSEEITPEKVPGLAKQLEIEGARDYTLDIADCLTDKALESLNRAGPIGDAGSALRELAEQLLKREL
jgi:geranylgeranyl diphosphate synthase type I